MATGILYRADRSVHVEQRHVRQAVGKRSPNSTVPFPLNCIHLHPNPSPATVGDRVDTRATPRLSVEEVLIVTQTGTVLFYVGGQRRKGCVWTLISIRTVEFLRLQKVLLALQPSPGTTSAGLNGGTR